MRSRRSRLSAGRALRRLSYKGSRRRPLPGPWLQHANLIRGQFSQASPRSTSRNVNGALSRAKVPLLASDQPVRLKERALCPGLNSAMISVVLHDRPGRPIPEETPRRPDLHRYRVNAPHASAGRRRSWPSHDLEPYERGARSSSHRRVRSQTPIFSGASQDRVYARAALQFRLDRSPGLAL